MKGLRQRSIARLRGQRFLDEEALRLNLSFVLHDHSTSETVITAARASEHHARRVAQIPWHTLKILEPSSGPGPDLAGAVLTARIGIPAAFDTYLAHRYPRATILFADHGAGPLQTAMFFRAEANLTLPASHDDQIHVAGLIMRSGYHSAQLVRYGPYRWPKDRQAVLRSLERLIQPHAEQWMPIAPLWRAPVEDMLPDEIVEPR